MISLTMSNILDPPGFAATTLANIKTNKMNEFEIMLLTTLFCYKTFEDLDHPLVLAFPLRAFWRSRPDY